MGVGSVINGMRKSPPKSKSIARPVRADGRVAIPADIRRELGLDTGDYVVLDVRPLEEGDP